MDGGMSMALPVIRPCTEINPGAARLSRHIGGVFETPQFAAKIVEAPGPDRPDVADAVICLGRIGDAEFHLTAPARLIDALLARHRFAPGIMSFPADLRPLLIELVLEDSLLALEALPKAPALQLHAVETYEQAPPEAACIGLACRFGDDRKNSCLLKISVMPQAVPELDALLERAVRPRRNIAALPVTLILERARVRLTLADLRDAGAGDVILVPGLAQRLPRLLLGPVWWPIQARDDQWEISGTMQKQNNQGILPRPDPTSASGGISGALDALPVELCFELGRLTRPLAEIETLQPGQVLILPEGDASQVSIVANGLVIGAGDIVSVGDEAGIRIRWIGGHDATKP